MRCLGVLILLVGTARADDVAAARDHYRAATKAYEVGQYDEAIREFASAYKLKDDPTILFNLGQAHRLAGHKMEALRAYRNYLNRVPNAPNREEVQRQIAVLSVASDDPDTEVAQRLFQKGADAYNARRYDEAITAFQQARTVKPMAALDFNIGRCYDRLGNTDQALLYYRQYVASTPTPADGDEVRQRIKLLEQRLTSPVAAPPNSVTPPNAATPTQTQVAPAVQSEAPRRRRWVIPVAITAVVAVGLAVGLGVGLGVQPSDPSSSLAPVHWK